MSITDLQVVRSLAAVPLSIVILSACGAIILLAITILVYRKVRGSSDLPKYSTSTSTSSESRPLLGSGAVSAGTLANGGYRAAPHTRAQGPPAPGSPYNRDRQTIIPSSIDAHITISPLVGGGSPVSSPLAVQPSEEIEDLYLADELTSSPELASTSFIEHLDRRNLSLPASNSSSSSGGGDAADANRIIVVISDENGHESARFTSDLVADSTTATSTTDSPTVTRPASINTNLPVYDTLDQTAVPSPVSEVDIAETPSHPAGSPLPPTADRSLSNPVASTPTSPSNGPTAPPSSTPSPTKLQCTDFTPSPEALPSILERAPKALAQLNSNAPEFIPAAVKSTTPFVARCCLDGTGQCDSEACPHVRPITVCPDYPQCKAGNDCTHQHPEETTPAPKPRRKQKRTQKKKGARRVR
ncbi:hypothetical protein BJ085DRAFT_40606 [Dimargaris cristalligena]|uniref:Uncharacterized protein n=1 Tax=Dimargaris cristalligena TaxID=215637 RepID=A0A4P9ZYJ7_9FUNG|nr:hypothetical protein BJ085DRAFT_40606 [Dimargaris cristalligena]|eukprot:RKP38763.1 hypothetical protein BJ085DRAFT_40606 [Dimargaris cristalligena]